MNPAISVGVPWAEAARAAFVIAMPAPDASVPGGRASLA